MPMPTNDSSKPVYDKPAAGSTDEIILAIQRIMEADTPGVNPDVDMLGANPNVDVPSVDPDVDVPSVDPDVDVPSVDPDVDVPSVDPDVDMVGQNSGTRVGSEHAEMRIRTALGRLTGESDNPPTMLEALILEALDPMLKNWLDHNLPAIVEQLVRKEIRERVTPLITDARD